MTDLALPPSLTSTIKRGRPAGAEDFDCLFGDWRVRHSRLKRRLDGCADWVEFGGRCNMRPILGGLGNIEENIVDIPTGAYEAVALRLFNPTTSLWSIWWIDARHPVPEPPVHGSFANGVGTFIGEDVFEGRPILVRFIWSDITDGWARWEQAFSEDGGASWEINWRMQFERLS